MKSGNRLMTRMAENGVGTGNEGHLPPVPPMVFVRGDGRIVGMNHVAESFFGMTLAQLDGALMGEALLDAEAQKVLADSMGVFEREGHADLMDRPRAVKTKRGDGTYCTILLSFSVVSAREGRQLAFAFHPPDSTPGQSGLLRRLIDAIPDNLYI